jgi:hypothetical protein
MRSFAGCYEAECPFSAQREEVADAVGRHGGALHDNFAGVAGQIENHRAFSDRRPPFLGWDIQIQFMPAFTQGH